LLVQAEKAAGIMGIDIRWEDDTRTTILIEFDEQWTWEDFEQIEIMTSQLLDEVDHKVCFLADASQTRTIPPNVSISRMRRVIELNHANSDIIVVAGMNMFLRLMLDTVIRVLKSQSAIHTVKDMQEAREKLAQHRGLAQHKGLTQHRDHPPLTDT
jgi:hypothetical protein